MPKSPSGLRTTDVATAVVTAVEAALARMLKPAPRGQQKKPAAPPPRKAKQRQTAKGSAESPRDRHGFRGLPPPATFDFEALPDTSWLTESETAAVLRVAISTLAAWRQRPNPPLKCAKLRDRQIRYQVKEIRRFLAGGERPRRGRPRKKTAVAPRRPRGRPTAPATSAPRRLRVAAPVEATS